MAAKATPAPSPSLHDLAGEIQRQVIRARSELDDARRRLDELHSEREMILSAPMHSSDILSELERHLRIKAREASQYLRETITEMRDRSAGHVTVSPDTVACFAPLEKSTLPEVLAVLTDPADAARRLLVAAGELPGVEEGMPLIERRVAVAKLDEQIAAAVETESALVESLAAAGIRIAMPTDPIPDPEPGERRMIGGKLQEWGTYTGTSYGWVPVEEAA